MKYIKNQILQNNAIEAWAMAIRHCDYILEGKATLEYRKHFVSVFHNSVELFIKQLMLNNTDYRVTQLYLALSAGCGYVVTVWNRYAVETISMEQFPMSKLKYCGF